MIWRPLVLISLLVAHKVWDDWPFLSNADYAFVYPFFTTGQINRIERKFLELLQYDVIVKPNVYVKYYFELNALSKNFAPERPQKPIDHSQERSMGITLHEHGE